mgnify:CR=1 FL=1|tara:strand:- start:24373 stop:24564 length:192 start_codon:yes stop_codon:yes gene_type:complete
MKTPRITKNLFLGWDTEDLIQHLDYLTNTKRRNAQVAAKCNRPFNDADRHAASLIKEVLAERT